MPEATAASAWGEQLARWAIPDEVLARAPESPYFFDVGEFASRADGAVARKGRSVSDSMALQALSLGGSVLDVGSGAGAASLPLAGRAGLLLAVDERAELLAAFAARAEAIEVPFRGFEGRWPDVAGDVPVAEVAVSHHVAYNVADLSSFALALGSHARRRVVLELTAAHPLAWTSPYWRALHGVVRPEGPVAADAAALLREAALDVREVRWRQPRAPLDAAAFERLARRLCLGPDRHAELAALLRKAPPPRWRDLSTIWWDVQGA